MSWLLAIDYGTTNTSAAAHLPQGVQVLNLFGRPELPSCVLVQPDGTLLTGEDAERESGLRLDHFVATPKRHFGEEALLIGGQTVPVVALVAATLRTVGDEARRLIGSPPSKVVLTYPARWGSEQIARLREAGRLANLGECVTVAEPIAAAAGFERNFSVTPGALFAVFDLGGGTLDVAVLRDDPDGDGVAVVGSGGVDPLGGEDLDAALTDHVLRSPRLIGAAGDALREPTDFAHRMQRRALQRNVRGAKESLSRTESSSFPVPGVDHGATLTRSELDTVIRPHVERAATELARVLDDAGVSCGELETVFLAGGSSRLPLVGTTIRQSLPGVRVETVGDPKTITAEGATTLVPMAGSDLPPPSRTVWAPPSEGLVLPRRRRSPVLMGVATIGLAGLAGVGFLVSRGESEGPIVAPPTTEAPTTTDDRASEDATTTEPEATTTEPETTTTSELETRTTTTTEPETTTTTEPREFVGDVDRLYDRFPTMWTTSCFEIDGIEELEKYVEECDVIDVATGAPLLFFGQVLEPWLDTEAYLDELSVRPDVTVLDWGTWDRGGEELGSYLDFQWTFDDGTWTECRAWGDFGDEVVGWLCGVELDTVASYWSLHT